MKQEQTTVQGVNKRKEMFLFLASTSSCIHICSFKMLLRLRLRLRLRRLREHALRLLFSLSGVFG